MMNTARGLSFGSREAKDVMARLGMRGKIQNNNHQWHATAQGVSHAAAKHLARFWGLRVLHALCFAPQPNRSVKGTPTGSITLRLRQARRPLLLALGHGLTQALEAFSRRVCGSWRMARLNLREWLGIHRPFPSRSIGGLLSRPSANPPITSPRGTLRSLNLAVSPSAACSPSRRAQVPHATAKMAACPSAISTPVCAVSSPRHRRHT